MRVLILGGDGMLGHRALIELAKDHQVVVTLRQDSQNYSSYSLFSFENAIFGVDARDLMRLVEVIGGYEPDVVINAIGMVKQRQASVDVIQTLEINALLPHRLAAICRAARARLIHISTDCVFSGLRGSYSEDDVPEASDLYGRSKLLGEVTGPGCITLRTSIIGLELKRRKSLIEWYLAARGPIPGYTRAIYSGLTTIELARVIRLLIERFRDCEGLYHVVAEPISKYEILRQLTGILGRTDVSVVPEDSFVCDRSMRGERFEKATGYRAPSWDQLLRELGEEIRGQSTR
jgi:dTDP-4-dehydrorhamnose reductase